MHREVADGGLALEGPEGDLAREALGHEGVAHGERTVVGEDLDGAAVHQDPEVLLLRCSRKRPLSVCALIAPDVATRDVDLPLLHEEGKLGVRLEGEGGPEVEGGTQVGDLSTLPFVQRQSFEGLRVPPMIAVYPKRLRFEA